MITSSLAGNGLFVALSEVVRRQQLTIGLIQALFASIKLRFTLCTVFSLSS